MKTTGVIVMLVGMAIALFAGAAMLMGPADTIQTGAVDPQIDRGYLYAPMVFGLLVLGVGAGIMLFGGKGYFIGRPRGPRPAIS
jgi:hypothetical protein